MSGKEVELGRPKVEGGPQKTSPAREGSPARETLKKDPLTSESLPDGREYHFYFTFLTNMDQWNNFW